MDPVNPNFVKFWTSGKGSKWNFVKKIKTTLFSEQNLKTVFKDWEYIRPDESRHIHDEESEEYPNPYESNSINEEFTSKYSTEVLDELYTCAIDWFHFGVCMIQLIMKINTKTELIDVQYINRIWEFFCAKPLVLHRKVSLLFDKNYTFDMLFASSYSETRANSKVDKIRVANNRKISRVICSADT